MLGRVFWSGGLAAVSGLDPATVVTRLDRLQRRELIRRVLSTDLDEVLSMADRCLVIYRGRLVAHWPRGELDRERVGLAMGGAGDRAAPARISPAVASEGA